MFFAALGVPALVVALATVTLGSYLVGVVLDKPRRTGSLALGRSHFQYRGALRRSSPTRVVVREKHVRRTPRHRRRLLFHLSRHLLHRRRLRWREKSERHLGYFALYMAFFPKALQGPIERAGELLPQLRWPFQFDPDGWRVGAILFAWGSFKKMAG